mmetsp:Transcript_114984/g.245546  ORF Transcript_114984/g.245546 Transcript_114984/m.245546 type:complete len:200 (-) Transcript_114984:174-773(-)
MERMGRMTRRRKGGRFRASPARLLSTRRGAGPSGWTSSSQAMCCWRATLAPGALSSAPSWGTSTPRQRRRQSTCSSRLTPAPPSSPRPSTSCLLPRHPRDPLLLSEQPRSRRAIGSAVSPATATSHVFRCPQCARTTMHPRACMRRSQSVAPWLSRVSSAVATQTSFLALPCPLSHACRPHTKRRTARSSRCASLPVWA